MVVDHLTSWCGYTINSKHKFIYTNFLKYTDFRRSRVRRIYVFLCVRALMRQDITPFSSIYQTIFLVLRARLHSSRVSGDSSKENVRIVVYSSVLFAVKRTLRDYRVYQFTQMKKLIASTIRIVKRRVSLELEEIRWLVNHAFLAVIRKSRCYEKTTAFLYWKIMRSAVRDELIHITQHPSIQLILQFFELLLTVCSISFMIIAPSLIITRNRFSTFGFFLKEKLRLWIDCELVFQLLEMLIPFVHMDLCPFLLLAVNKRLLHHWKIGNCKRILLILLVLKNQQLKKLFCLSTCKMRAAHSDFEPQRATIPSNLTIIKLIDQKQISLTLQSEQGQDHQTSEWKRFF